MNFFIPLFLSIFISTSALATEKIDTILDSRPGGLASRMIEIVENSLGEKHGKRIIVDNCAAMTKYIKNSKTPILAIGYPDMQIGKNPCYQEEENFYGFLGSSPMYLCVRTENEKYAINNLFMKDIFIGYADFPWLKQKSQKLIKSIGSNAKGIPYSNSAAAKAALVNGEINYMISSLLQDGEICPIILDENLQNEAIIRGIDLFPESNGVIFSYSVFLLGSNLPRNKDILENILNSVFWENRVDFRYKEMLIDLNLSEQYMYLNVNH
jgi:hypothetical protein